MLEISAVIVNYNSGDWLQKCIHALRQSSYSLKEIVIVDNASNDASRRYLDTLEQEVNTPQVPAFKILKNTKNLGYSTSNNIGVANCSSDLVLIVNPDALVGLHTIEVLVKNFVDLNDYKVILAPVLENMDGSHQVSYWKFIRIVDLLKECFFIHYLFPSKYRLCSDSLCVAEALSGAAFVISKKRWEELNGLDENLFWMEDVDLCYRNVQLGGKNYITRQTRVVHYGGGSSEKSRSLAIANQVFSRLKFFHKHATFYQWTAAWLLLFFQCLTRWMLFSILYLFYRNIKFRRIGYALALKHLLLFLLKHDKKIITSHS